MSRLDARYRTKVDSFLKFCLLVLNQKTVILTNRYPGIHCNAAVIGHSTTLFCACVFMLLSLKYAKMSFASDAVCLLLSTLMIAAFVIVTVSSMTSIATRSNRGARSFRIHVQLDYHPSSQYAGIHLALKSGLYSNSGLEVTLAKPGADGGDEPKLVADNQAQFDKGGLVDTISIGIVEQNVLIPAISNNVKVKAFASIFQRTPLILLGLPGTKLDSVADLKDLKIGMHIDSTELMKTIVFHSKDSTSTVQTVQRADKMDQLIKGSVHAIQVRVRYL